MYEKARRGVMKQKKKKERFIELHSERINAHIFHSCNTLPRHFILEDMKCGV
jgi:hypothetical protein